MAPQRKKNPRTALHTSGVPLGGIGTGAVELGQDSRFRNITINNNRCARTRLPVSAPSFLAFRVTDGERLYSRILQTELTPQIEKTEPPRLREGKYEWHCLYPQSDFHLLDAECPLDVYWSGLAPIIPYDLDASSLPALFIRVKIINRADRPLDVAVVFNWENLVGVTRTRRPETRGLIDPVTVKPKVEAHTITSEDEQAKMAPNGLWFHTEAIAHDADGAHCLAVMPHPDTNVSLLTWDPDHLGDWRNFWESFRFKGTLKNLRLHGAQQKCGAVCASFRLEKEETFHVDYVLSWHCPQYTLQGVEAGNNYTNRFPGAVEAAAEGLKHLSYYASSVHNWQQSFLKSSLPKWLNRRLVNSCHIFSTNTVYTRNGDFAVLESPEQPVAGRLDDRLYHSFAVMLFYPRLETATLQQAADTVVQRLSEGWAHALDSLSLTEKVLGGPEAAVTIVANLVLSAYRNFIATGSLARMQELYTNLHLLASVVQRMDTDRDGLPEVKASLGFEGVAVPGLSSYAAGLWVCALRALAEIAHRLHFAEEASRYAELFKRARVSFEQRYWEPEVLHFRWFADQAATGKAASACHAAQLAGQFFGHFLGFGPLFSDQHLDQALTAMVSRLERDSGAANLAGEGILEVLPAGYRKRFQANWLAHTVVHLDSLLVRRGHKEAGYRLLQKHFGNLRRRKDLLFDVPQLWNIEDNDAFEGCQHRHRSLLGIWHALFALQGFFYDGFLQKMSIIPQLPADMPVLSSPLFTAFALGWLRYEEQPGEIYTQWLEITFEIPVSVKTLELRIPQEVQEVAISCDLPTGSVTVTHEILGGEEKRVLVHAPRGGISISGTFSLRLRQVAAPPARFPGRRLFR